MITFDPYKYRLKCACIGLYALEQRQGGLINGNFTYHAKQKKIKVKDLLKAYREYKKINK